MAYRQTDTLAVRVSSYEQAGQTKYRYHNVGHVLVEDDGREMMTLNRFFNPAGCLQDGRDSVILYRFQKDRKGSDPLSPFTSPTVPLDNIPF